MEVVEFSTAVHPLQLLRSSLVNNRTQAVVCDDLGMVEYTIYPYPKGELKTKDRADILEGGWCPKVALLLLCFTFLFVFVSLPGSSVCRQGTGILQHLLPSLLLPKITGTGCALSFMVIKSAGQASHPCLAFLHQLLASHD